ncbi:MAG TPA: hypothetical protein PLD47_10310 [Aggregatilineales bacterium]|nr:phosphoglucosamine mutase [Anaerolineales bacterium]HRE48107.1 hypothetical protein [Aggregatilineales bacterium]
MTTHLQFGTDGIRGVAGEFPLDPTTVFAIGRALGVWLKTTAQPNKADLGTVILGRDPRISSDFLAHTLALGLLAEGITVVDRRVISTPGIAYLTVAEHHALGIMITASHNPAEQNGIKVFGADGYKLNDEAEQAIIRLVDGQHTPLSAFPGRLTYHHMDTDAYERDLLKACAGIGLENLTIILDMANGAGFFLAPGAFWRAGASVFTINADPDGFNINVEAGSEYVRRDRTDLLTMIHKRHADMGFAFDGDADRLVCVTPDGMLVDGDHLLGILAVDLKNAGLLTGETVVATEMSNSGLEDFLRREGITLLRTKVGDRYVMEAMRKGGYTLGGEQAGHIILRENNLTAGDGIYTALRLAALCARRKRTDGASLASLAAAIPRYPQVIASAHLDRRLDLTALPGLEGKKRETLEMFGGGRVNLRFSGTEPNVLRAMVEGGAHTPLEDVVRRALLLCQMVAEAAHTESPLIDIVDCVTGAPVRVKG